MAVLKAGRNGPTKHPSSAGRYYLYTQNGRVVMAAWPQNRKPRNNPVNAFWRDWFSQANLLAKYAAASEQAEAKRITAGSALYPRDILLMCMRGRAWGILTHDGRKIYPVAAQQDVTRSLDIIAQTPGSMLFRGSDLWTYIPPGANGQILSFDAATLTPEWIDPPSSGGGSSTTSYVGTTTQTALDAAMGNHWTPALDTTITALWGRISAQAGYTAHVEIWTSTAGTLGALVAQSSAQTFPAAATVYPYWHLTAAAALAAGQEYTTLLVRTDGSGTTSARPFFGTSSVFPLPSTGPFGYALYASNAPATGLVPATYANVGYIELNMVYGL